MSRQLTKVLAAVVAVSLTGSLFAAESDKADARATTATPSRDMTRALPEIKFTSTPLSDVINFLNDSTGINFSVDWKSLEAATITKDTPITLRLNGNVTIRKALNLILDQAGGAGVLTFYVDQGVVQITTNASADKTMITKVYGIDDLLFEARDANNVPSLSIDSTSSNGGGGGEGGGGGGGNTQLFGGGGSSNLNGQSNTISTRQQRADAIIKLITDTVRPEIWKINGGEASISFFRGSLLVTAPRSVHELLASR